MIPENIKKKIVFHSQPEEGSFLRMLRPYQGLQDEVYQDLIESLRKLQPYLLKEKYVDKELMAALWIICFCMKFWGTEPDSMLVRNELISEEDRNKLRTWANEIMMAVSQWLQDQPKDLDF